MLMLPHVAIVAAGRWSMVDGQWSMVMVSSTRVEASVETSRIFFIEGRSNQRRLATCNPFPLRICTHVFRKSFFKGHKAKSFKDIKDNGQLVRLSFFQIQATP